MRTNDGTKKNRRPRNQLCIHVEFCVGFAQKNRFRTVSGSKLRTHGEYERKIVAASAPNTDMLTQNIYVVYSRMEIDGIEAIDRRKKQQQQSGSSSRSNNNLKPVTHSIIYCIICVFGSYVSSQFMHVQCFRKAFFVILPFCVAFVGRCRCHAFLFVCLVIERYSTCYIYAHMKILVGLLGLLVWHVQCNLVLSLRRLALCLFDRVICIRLLHSPK